MTRDEQITKIQKAGLSRFLRLARPGMVLVAAGLLLAGALTFNPAFYAAALAAGLVALAVWVTVPHMQNAALGLTGGIRQKGSVAISLRKWSDGEGERESYSGVISMNHQPLWEMDFVQPDGWEPAPGIHEAELAFIRGVRWPVVILLDRGILYPAGKPRPAARS